MSPNGVSEGVMQVVVQDNKLPQRVACADSIAAVLVPIPAIYCSRDIWNSAGHVARTDYEIHYKLSTLFGNFLLTTTVHTISE